MLLWHSSTLATLSPLCSSPISFPPRYTCPTRARESVGRLVFPSLINLCFVSGSLVPSLALLSKFYTATCEGDQREPVRNSSLFFPLQYKLRTIEYFRHSSPRASSTSLVYSLFFSFQYKSRTTERVSTAPNRF